MIDTNELVSIVVAFFCLVGAIAVFIWMLNWIEPSDERNAKQEVKSKIAFNTIMILSLVGWMCVVAMVLLNIV